MSLHYAVYVCTLLNRANTQTNEISQWENDEILPKMLLHLYVDYRNKKKARGTDCMSSPINHALKMNDSNTNKATLYSLLCVFNRFSCAILTLNRERKKPFEDDFMHPNINFTAIKDTHRSTFAAHHSIFSFGVANIYIN